MEQSKAIDKIINDKIAHKLDAKHLATHKSTIQEYRKDIIKNVYIEGAQAVKELSKDNDNTIIYLGEHKAWIDIPLDADAIFEEGLRTPLIIGGTNIYVPLVMKALRTLYNAPDPKKCGMIGVDREQIIRDRTYGEAFFTYLERMATEGKDLWVYPQGTRNRNGNILPVKTKTIEQYIKGTDHEKKKLYGVPVAQTIEIVPDLDSISDVDELKKLKKIRRKRIKSKERKFDPIGDVYLWFNDNLLNIRIGAADIKAIRNHTRAGYAAINEAHVDFGTPKLLTPQTNLRDYAKEIRQFYHDKTRVTTTAIVSTALQKRREDGDASHYALCVETENLLEQIKTKAPFSKFVEQHHESKKGIDEIVMRGIAGLNASRKVSLNKFGTSYEFTPEIDKRIEYYANSIKHFLE